MLADVHHIAHLQVAGSDNYTCGVDTFEVSWSSKWRFTKSLKWYDDGTFPIEVFIHIYIGLIPHILQKCALYIKN